MPRKTKDQKELENEAKKVEKIAKKPSKTTAKKSTTKKADKKSTSTAEKKSVTKSKTAKTTEKKATSSTVKKSVAKSKTAKTPEKKVAAKAVKPKTAKTAAKKTASATEKKSTKASPKTTTKKSTKTKADTKATAPANKKVKAKTPANTKTKTKVATKTKAKATAKTPKKTTTNTKTKATTKTSTRATTRRKKKVEILEYYDLPYRYNQTVVKVLAQTPNNLFIYWDISDEDRENFKKQYGENFFESTKPVLIIHNDTLDYSFEVEINDFANSWYLYVNDAKCNYRIELGRKPYEKNEKINTDYIYISTSNGIESPNDRILFDKNQKMVYFRNVKTGEVSGKPVNTISFLRNMGKIYNIYDLYKAMYKDEDIDDIVSNPSSGNPSSHSLSSKFM